MGLSGEWGRSRFFLGGADLIFRLLGFAQLCFPSCLLCIEVGAAQVEQRAVGSGPCLCRASKLVLLWGHPRSSPFPTSWNSYHHHHPSPLSPIVSGVFVSLGNSRPSFSALLKVSCTGPVLSLLLPSFYAWSSGPQVPQ